MRNIIQELDIQHQLKQERSEGWEFIGLLFIGAVIYVILGAAY